MSKLLEGKLALILGIANRWSLAYSIAQAFSRRAVAGAHLFGGAAEGGDLRAFQDFRHRRLIPATVTKDEKWRRWRLRCWAGPPLHAVVHSLAFATARTWSGLSRNQPGRFPAGAERERVFAWWAWRGRLVPVMTAVDLISTLTYLGSTARGAEL